jgi:hypothetical protein
LTPAAVWGLFGSARGGTELTELLRQALMAAPVARLSPSSGHVFAAFGQQAACAAADAILKDAVHRDSRPDGSTVSSFAEALR